MTAAKVNSKGNGILFILEGQPTIFQSGLAGITALSAKNIWAVGGSASNGTFIEHYDGNSWSQIPTNINIHGGFGGITINPKNGNVWVVGAILGNNLFWQTLTAFYN